ncbi:diacylglycerol kinase family lipid kinase [Olivibacter ginsenosidimutans]|uniref:Diacylglycerol kinase family lipid kinase n=1 Tax=Olivibacter ginsenosidimutans TaxID=1176537 RepID=A0ABP9ADL8_9SPHI
MKRVLVLHNPKAGDEDHQKKELITAIESAGYTCIYSAIRQQKWKEEKYVDTILIVGGDGTVRKTIEHLLKIPHLTKRHLLSILPRGTANNIAVTLGSKEHINDLLERWKKHRIKKVDLGVIQMPAAESFFLEGVGYGFLPRLIAVMAKLKISEHIDKKEELNLALEKLLHVTATYKAKRAMIRVNGQELVGDFLLVEVLNNGSVGPKLRLAPEANMSDGWIEVVLLREDQREQFIHYLQSLIDGGTAKCPCQVVRTNHAEIQWECAWLHVDDKLVRLKRKTKLQLGVRHHVLNFLV